MNEVRPRIGLTERSLLAAVGQLAARDGTLAAIVARLGPPPLWSRPAGFPTLVYIMLEQQVSLASARAAFNRLVEAVEPLTPSGFLELDDRQLLAIGFSRQKTRYVRSLARAIEAGAMDLDSLAAMSDPDAHEALVSQLGIGPWTASIYLMEALLRPDVWPAGDMALVTAVVEAQGLADRPTYDQMMSIGEAWRPWRSVAARIFWHDYLSRRGRSLNQPERSVTD